MLDNQRSMTLKKPVVIIIMGILCLHLTAIASGCNPDYNLSDKPDELPSTYGDVAVQYTELREKIISAGREVIGLLKDNNLEAVYSQFTPEMKKLNSMNDLQDMLSKYAIDGLSPGKTIDERIWPISYYYRRYTAEYNLGDQTIIIRIGFNENFDIYGLEISSPQPLPADPAIGYKSTSEWRLPFNGLWWVYYGGDTLIKNYHVTNHAQRHACDLVVWKDGGTHRGTGRVNEDYWAYEQPVLAPSDGIVITVLDGIEDNKPRIPNTESHHAGNHVVINTGEGEYLFIAHFKQGSIRIKKGDIVHAGDILGLTGNSGRSYEPHIHIHLQSKPEYSNRDTTGLPLNFYNLVVDGKPVDKDILVQGQFIRQSPKISRL